MAAMPRSRPALRSVLALALAGLAACGGDDDRGGGLPAPGDGPPEAYRIVYEVTTPDGQGREELVVRRPFAASTTERGPDGEATAQRVTALGLLVTTTGGEATAIETAIAPAAGDLRPERFADRLVEAGRLEEGEAGEVGGRACRRVVERDTVATDGRTGQPGAGSFPVVVTRCVDRVGLVLEERIATPGGQAVRTRRAVELEVGDAVGAIDVPDVGPLPVAQGGGSVEELVGPSPVARTWMIEPPEGFEAVGTFVVEPARLGGAATAGSLALVTEVWRRGPDLLLLDQGRAGGGATPFDPATEVGPLDLPGVGPAALALDLRLAEVRVAGADGGFVRVAGTLPLDELVAAARTLQPRPAAG